MEKDLTTGSVLKNIVFFSLPYLLSYFLQTLYGMADLFIIGQFDSVASITAVSVGSQVMHMLTVMIVGLAMGATVTIGKADGPGFSCGGKYSDFVYGSRRNCYDRLTVAREADRGGHVHTGGGSIRNDYLSDDMLHRNSVYYSIQYYQFDFSRAG